MARDTLSAMALIAPVALMGCGVGPGDYRVYRVGLEATQVSPLCYFPEEEPPPELAQDVQTSLAPTTMVIYFAAGDRVLLDFDGLSFEGDSGGDGFEFEASTVDVSYVGEDRLEARVAVVTTTSIDMEVDGDAVAGDIVSTDRFLCDFLTATPSPGLCEATPDCERRTRFSGVELHDVELTSGINEDNPI